MLRKREKIRPEISGIVLTTMVGLAALSWDLEIWQWVCTHRIPGDLRKTIHLSEVFAHSIGVAVLLGSLWWIDVNRRTGLVCIAGFTAFCGIVANGAKYFVPRIRPHSIDESETAIVSGWDTWGVPWTGSWFEESIRSFPSGHSATAVALAIGLSMIYPRGKWLFAAIAALACLQRLVASAHFVSDIMGGILVTLLISLWFRNSRFGRMTANCDRSSRTSDSLTKPHTTE